MMRTRIWPSPSAGRSTSPISKVSAVGSPLGRLATRTCRLFIGGSSLGWNAEIGAYPFGRLLADHDRRGVGVARDHGRHDRGIGDAQALQTMDPQAVVDHPLRPRRHATGADRVERDRKSTRLNYSH